MVLEDEKRIETIAIVLAAGSSSRMGQSKQLLKIGHQSLIRKTIKILEDAGLNKTVVVLGARKEEHQREIEDLKVAIVFNPNWEKGMGSSLKCGVRYVLENFPNAKSLIVTVCDQPLLTADHIKNLIRTHLAKKNMIVASFYGASPGTPVLFEQPLFKKLLAMDDGQGAKTIVLNNQTEAAFIEFPDGAVDLDTPDDWEKFNAWQK